MADSCVEMEPSSPDLRESEHILIIDDDWGQAEALGHRFRRLGYQVSIAVTGADGLDQARVEIPDLILLDLHLPDRDGFSVCRELTEDAKTLQVPVIIVSGLDRSDIVRDARAAGCRFFVRKPYDPNALLLLVQNALSTPGDW